MKTISTRVALLCVVVVSVLIGYSPSPLAAQGSSSPRDKAAEEYAASLPKDIYPDSRSRIPLIKREDLDEEGKKVYDDRVSPNTTSLAGLQGPGGLRLHGSRDIRETGVDRRLQELARLVVSREMDQAFEWTVHEPVALKEGLEPAIIDIVRYRKTLTGVGEKEAAIIQLGREVFGKHKVSSETFARALKQLGEKNLIDLCFLMGSYVTTAVLLTAVDLHLPYDRKALLPIP